MPLIEDIIARIHSNKKELGITIYPPATVQDIAAFEAIFGIIPDDMKILYSSCNGFESEEDWFRIIPLNEISDSCTSNENTLNSIFHIAEYMTYSDSWEMSIDSTNRNSYVVYNAAFPATILTRSLAEFISVFLDGGVFDGLYKWREQIISGNHSH